MTAYTLNPAQASKAEQFGSRITETGAYKGIITQAIDVTATKGTKGIEFSFKSDDGLTADYLSVWTVKADGTELSGNALIHAVLMCVEVRGMASKPGIITRREDGKDVQVQADVFPELAGKRIGFVLAKAEYEKKDGTIGNKMEIVLPFEADTGRTADEKKQKAAKGERLAKIVALSKDRPLKPQNGRPARKVEDHGPAPTDGGFDDEIGF